ncbi:MAG: hypothetical protein ACO3JL_16635 [Myxococcota bacterium]
MPRGHAVQEFEAVFGGHMRWLGDDGGASYRRVQLQLPDEEIRRRSLFLGFASAVVEVMRLPLGTELGESPRAGQRLRREGDVQLLMTTVAELDVQPHPREGTPDRRRRLSVYDARWCANLLPVPEGARVLDPFAGLGTLAAAAEERGLRVVALEFDPVTGGGCRRAVRCVVRADARYPPHASGTFDAVLSEPPYREHERAVVRSSLPRLCEMVRPQGVLGLLLSESLCRDLLAMPVVRQLHLERDASLIRHGWPCRYLVLRKRSGT